jgi:DNA-binding PadR family transcriptional regulator
VAVSSTRLLILGAVRIFQPVHGYFVRRELMTWRADEWAHLNPGSVYNALRGLTRDGFLEEVEAGDGGGRPARTSYRLTPDGETEFFELLRRALWTVEPFAPDVLLAGASFMWALSREEVAAALEHRIAQILAANREHEFVVHRIEDEPSPTPPHVAELLRLGDARMRGEREWAESLLARVHAGELTFAGEPEQWQPPDARRAAGGEG